MSPGPPYGPKGEPWTRGSRSDEWPDGGLSRAERGERTEGPVKGDNRKSSEPLTGPPNPESALEAVAAERLVLEEYRPIAEALDWTIGQIYFSRYGQSAFVRGDVPFAVHNDGHLSKLAADLLFTTLSAADAEGTLEREIAILELGVGSGLFARYFLDRFRQRCHEAGKDYYDRCRYI